uniref:Uncharacterized protein n=1 Tax=Tanacetum cinerariifolium TaxID=118510 RepID=A0A6L2M2S4_TANCI|nr:hypothetical protein [Tanacetum cinerariifolium]
MASVEDIKLLLFKVDFEKAFDSVNWSFLIDIMRQMGFGSKWRGWISSCLSSASILVLVNVSPSKEFKLERGLRQGNPLSPFLFLIVFEALQVSILEACDNGLYKGIFLANSGANSSFLQYANDALFFGEWSRNYTSCLIYILRCFELASCLKINFDKSRVFGVGVPDNEEFYGEDGGFDFTDNSHGVGDLCSNSGVRIADVFPRLHTIDQSKGCTIADMWHFSNNVWGGNWDWHIPPRGRALDDLSNMINLIEEHGIHYRPRTSVKRQILADFIMERPKDDSPDTPMEDKEELPVPWILFTDGSSCIDAEYKALIAGLWIAEQIGVESLQANVDSRLVANQVNGSYIAKELGMIQYLEKENYVLRESHGGSCSMRVGPRFVVTKALRSGYYWPTMHADVKKLIRECNSFQWIEVKPMASITGAQVKKFLWDNIVCRFGLPGEIKSDNGKQFTDNPFKDWCEKLCICQHFTFVKHPQANGLVERANRRLCEGIKAQLNENSKNWIEEISHVLWAHRTIIKSSNIETPCSLTYGTEADLKINLDLLEKKGASSNPGSKNQSQDGKILQRQGLQQKFQASRDLVYRSNKASHAEDGGKLRPRWDGPYAVTEALGKGAYKLRDHNENILLQTWNVCNLKK